MSTSDSRLIKPTGNDYPEQFFSTIYAAHLSFADGERRLIWGRFSGFLIIEGFIINALLKEFNQQPLSIQIALSIAGCIVSIAWILINHAGWLSQNMWLKLAAGFNFSKLNIALISDHWKDEKSAHPAGSIYTIAQLIPSAFIIIYSTTLGLSIHPITSGLNYGFAFILLAPLISFFAILFLIKKLNSEFIPHKK